MVYLALGKNYRLFMDIVLIVLFLGFLIGFVIIISQLIPDFLISFGVISDIKEYTSLYRFIQIFGFGLILFPIYLIRDLSGLQYVSYLGVFSICYTTFIIIF